MKVLAWKSRRGDVQAWGLGHPIGCYSLAIPSLSSFVVAVSPLPISTVAVSQLAVESQPRSVNRSKDSHAATNRGKRSCESPHAARALFVLASEATPRTACSACRSLCPVGPAGLRASERRFDGSALSESEGVPQVRRLSNRPLFWQLL